VVAVEVVAFAVATSLLAPPIAFLSLLFFFFFPHQRYAMFISYNSSGFFFDDFFLPLWSQ
jgi:hypothetical protein